MSEYTREQLVSHLQDHNHGCDMCKAAAAMLEQDGKIPERVVPAGADWPVVERPSADEKRVVDYWAHPNIRAVLLGGAAMSWRELRDELERHLALDRGHDSEARP